MITPSELRAWAGDDPMFAAYVGWLMSADPDQRHCSAVTHNWDNGYEPLYWILSQPDCDIATALAVRDLDDPAYYEQFGFEYARTPRHAHDGLRFNLFLRRQISDRFYTRSEIAYAGEGGVQLAGRIPDCSGYAEGMPWEEARKG